MHVCALHTCVYICICIVYTHVYVYVHIGMYVYGCVYVHVYMCTCVSVWARACVCGFLIHGHSWKRSPLGNSPFGTQILAPQLPVLPPHSRSSREKGHFAKQEEKCEPSFRKHVLGLHRNECLGKSLEGYTKTCQAVHLQFGILGNFYFLLLANLHFLKFLQ